MVYARFSSADQWDDLDWRVVRVVVRVVEWATRQGLRPDEVVNETGSGVNGNRSRLRRLAANPTVKTIVAGRRQRLWRFGFEDLAAALTGRGARPLVVDEIELEEDLGREASEKTMIRYQAFMNQL